ncbi:hypothetical protein [Shimia sp. MIT1388]|uniref:hypothetical protein n=1 Tax=Shimia sp. MIT1388 TaxID=3096992 RepID=UPI00399B4DA8
MAETLASAFQASETGNSIEQAYAQVYPYLLMGLLVLAFVFVIGGLFQRFKSEKSIGWQFIRFTVLGTALPLIAILALTDKFGAETAGIFGAAIGYLFGKEDKES